MEIRVLKYFLAVADIGTITGAAKALHLTQPTLTRQLKDLEKELGQQLLIRTNHNVSLTQEGMMLKKRAQEIVDMVEKTETEFDSLKNSVSGEVSVGSGETHSMKLISRIIKEIQKEYPHIKFHLYSGAAEDIKEKLENGLLDFGVLIQPTDISKYDCITLPSKDIWGVIMRKDSFLAKKKFIEKKDLYNLPLITSRLVGKRQNIKNAYNEWFGEDRDKFNIVATYNLVYNAGLMVEEGVGYALGLDKLTDVSEISLLCFRPLEPKLEAGLDIIWKKSQIFSPASKLFLEKCKKNFKKQ